MALKEGQTTKVDWGERGKESESNYRKCMEKYTYLNDPKYEHKKEQLYLMTQQGLSAKFVQAFYRNDINIISRDLDLVRGIAVLIGEDYVMDQFFKRDFSLEEARELVRDYMAAEKYRQYPEIDQLIAENRKLTERFELQMEFLRKERENVQTYMDELLKKECEKQEIEKELIRVSMEHERDRCLEELLTAQEENKELRMSLKQTEENARVLVEEARMKQEERDQLLKQCEELKQQLSEKAEEKAGGEKEGGLCKLLSRCNAAKVRKEKAERNRYVLGVIGNPQYKKEQIEVILRAVQEGLPLPELRQLCEPGLPAQNMEVLLEFFMRGQAQSIGKEVKEDGSESAETPSGES